MLNNGENKAMENGYVVLPIEKYNELMKVVEDAQRATDKLIRLGTDYKGQVEIKFDNEQIYAAAKKLYETSRFNTPERELIQVESFGVWSSSLTHEIPAAEGEES